MESLLRNWQEPVQCSLGNTPGPVSSKEPVDTHLWEGITVVVFISFLAMPNCPSKNCLPFTVCNPIKLKIITSKNFCWYNYGRGWCIKTSQNPGVAKIVLTPDLTTKGVNSTCDIKRSKCVNNHVRRVQQKYLFGNIYFKMLVCNWIDICQNAGITWHYMVYWHLLFRTFHNSCSHFVLHQTMLFFSAFSIKSTLCMKDMKYRNWWKTK